MENFPINPNASSNVKWARYDPVRAVVSIDFKNAAGEYQSTYEYTGFTRQDWEFFRESKRPGEHFASHIRGKFQYKKVAAPKEPKAPEPVQKGLFE